MVISPRFKQVLVDRYIGQENYQKLHSETKKIILISCCIDFKRDKEAEFGTLYNYEKWRVSQFGFKSVSEYRGHLIKEVNGFKSFWEYRKSLTIKRGLCPMCWEKKEKDDFVNCENCREKRRIKDKERYARSKMVRNDKT